MDFLLKEFGYLNQVFKYIKIQIVVDINFKISFMKIFIIVIYIYIYNDVVQCFKQEKIFYKMKQKIQFDLFRIFNYCFFLIIYYIFNF